MQVKTNILIHILWMQSFSHLPEYVNPLFVCKDILRTWPNAVKNEYIRLICKQYQKQEMEFICIDFFFNDPISGPGGNNFFSPVPIKHLIILIKNISEV